MAIIPLRAYNREIEGMIDNNQLDEAVAHCRYILATFPKHIATYRLMGKAHLEQQRISDATDIFQRVLSSVPDDFIANVGMSIIREDENNLDSAIWHMELAYEAEPSNAALQDELRRLYGRRDGVQPQRVRNTRGALARMYAKGGLFDLAIAELRAAIAEDPNRPDLQVQLAEMFFQTDQRVEAVETCANVLKKIPLCLKANQILAVSLPEAERSEAVKNYRQIAITMDPYFAYAGPDAFSSDLVPDNAVNLERLDWKSGIQAAEPPLQPNWATSLGISVEKPTDENLPEWLKYSAEPVQPSPTSDKSSASVSPFIWDTQEVKNVISETSKPEGEIPDWMKDAGWRPASAEASKPPEKIIPQERVEEPSAGEELEKAEIPDWLQGIAPAGALGEEKPAEEPAENTLSTPWLEQHQPGPSDSIIHWLEDNNPEKPRSRPPKADAAAELSEDEVPDWLKDLEPVPPAEGPKSAGPAFTIDPAALFGDKEPPAAPGGNESPFTVPIEKTAEEAEQSQPPEVKSALPGMPAPAEPAPDLEDIPDWLKQLAEEQPPAPTIAAEQPTPAEEVIKPGIAQPSEAEPAVEPPVTPVETPAEQQPPAAQITPVEALPAESVELPFTEVSAFTEPLPAEEVPAPVEQSAALEVPAMEEQPAPAEVPEAKEEAPAVEQPELAASEQPAAPEAGAPAEETPLAEEVPLAETPISGEQAAIPEALAFDEELPGSEQPADGELPPIPEFMFDSEALQPAEAPVSFEPGLPAEEIKPATDEHALSWLEDLAAEQSAKAESQPTPGEGGEMVPPEWVKLDTEPPLEDLSTLDTKPLEPKAVPAEDIPDWIKGLGDETEAAVAPVEPEAVVTPELEFPESEDLPAWLRELEEPEAEKGEAAAGGEELEWRPEELPAWLREITESETTEATPAAVEAEAVSPAMVEEQPAMEAPVEVQPAAEAPVEATPAMEVPIEAQPASEVPAEVLPSAEALVEAMPAMEAPVEAPPAAEAPAEVLPIAEAPVVAPSAAEVLAEVPTTAESSMEAMPAMEAPVEAPPAAEAPAEVPPTAEAPVEAMPAMEAPVEAPPAAETPAEVQPVIEAPSGPAPAVEAPIAEPVAPLTIQPATEWSAEVTPPAGIRREALEAVPVEPAAGQPLVEAPAEAEPAIPVQAAERIAEPALPAAEEVLRMESEPSLAAFEALSKANQSTLGEARNAVDSGQPTQAVELYTGLIRQSYHLDEIIKDLQDALYRFPIDIGMWVALGDAHMRSDDLQEALSAYTKSEELVR